FRTMFSRRRDWPIERALALAPVEARQMSAREHRPRNAVEIEVNTSRPISDIRRQINFRQRGLRGVGTGNEPKDVPGLIHACEANVHRLAPDGIVDGPRFYAVERTHHSL